MLSERGCTSTGVATHLSGRSKGHLLISESFMAFFTLQQPYNERRRWLCLHSLSWCHLHRGSIAVCENFTEGLDFSTRLFFMPPVWTGLRSHPFQILQSTAYISCQNITLRVSIRSVQSGERCSDMYIYQSCVYYISRFVASDQFR